MLNLIFVFRMEVYKASGTTNNPSRFDSLPLFAYVERQFLIPYGYNLRLSF